MRRRAFVQLLAAACAVGCGSESAGFSGGTGPNLSQNPTPFAANLSQERIFLGSGAGGVLALILSETGLLIEQAGRTLFNDPGPTRGGQLNLPLSLGQDARGDLFVADGGLRRVFALRSSGLELLAGPGEGDSQLGQPQSLAVDARDQLVYIADILRHRILVFSTSGPFLRAFGGPAELNGPHSLALDAAGNLHVSEVGNNQISVFSSGGSLLRSYGGYGPALGQFLQCRDVVVLDDGRSLVADPTTRLLTLFDQTGTPQTRFSVALNGRPATPRRLVADRSGALFLTVLPGPD